MSSLILEHLGNSHNPVEQYEMMGTDDLLPHNIHELEQLDHAIKKFHKPWANAKYYTGWIALELASIYERMGRDDRTEYYLLQGHSLLEETARYNGHKLPKKVGINRTIAITEAQLDIVDCKIAHEQPDTTTLQSYLGNLAVYALDLMKDMPGKHGIRRELSGVATETIFASLILDIPSRFPVVPVPGSPRQEKPQYVMRTSHNHGMNKARDYTVVTYGKGLSVKERVPVQIKTAYKNGREEQRYHESVKFICADSHIHIQGFEEGRELASALAKEKSARNKTEKFKIDIAQRNILSELGITLEQ